MRILIVGILFLLFQSCAFHYGSVESTISNSNQSYKYIDVAAGYSKVNYFMGLGGLGKDMLASEAVRNMRMSVPLESNQTYENIVLNYKATWIGPFLKMEAMAVADVVEWKEGCNVEFSEAYKGLVSKNTVESYGNLNIYDKIVVVEGQDLIEGRIVSLNKKAGMIFYIDSRGRYKFRKFALKYLFWNDDRTTEKHAYKVGDIVVYTPTGADPYRYHNYSEGIIIALNNSYAVVNTDGRIRTIPINVFKIKKKE
jgi:hypothetical protein